MIGPSRELLTEQLQAAIADCESGRDDPFEVAVLAGLLSRRVASNAARSDAENRALSEAQRLRESGVLHTALPDEEQARDAVAQLQTLSTEHDEEERSEPIFDLDDLCAGAWFLGEPQRYATQVSEAVAAIHAVPETWRATATWAMKLLSTAAPLPGDPSLALWHCLASCADFAEPQRAD